MRRAKDEQAYRQALAKFFGVRDDVTLPEQGWPWPWDDSQTTDYAYAFEGGAVYACNFGGAWWPVRKRRPDREDRNKEAVFPDMSSRQKVTFGKRSGVMIVGPHGPIDNLD